MRLGHHVLYIINAVHSACWFIDAALYAYGPSSQLQHVPCSPLHLVLAYETSLLVHVLEVLSRLPKALLQVIKPTYAAALQHTPTSARHITSKGVSG